MKNLTALIRAAGIILHNEFDPQLFLTWKSSSFITLTNLLGPLHTYTENFSLLTAEINVRSLLTGKGILIAAREL
jgi:hypothetical protein